MITREQAQRRQAAQNDCRQAYILISRAFNTLKATLDRPKPSWPQVEQAAQFMLEFATMAKERETALLAIEEEISGVAQVNGHDSLPIIPPTEDAQ